MTIITKRSALQLTEADLLALSLRFEIRGSLGKRQFYVDGVEVNERAYNRAVQKAAKAEAAGREPKPYPRRARR